MPTYEYACPKCSHEFERDQSISDDPVKTCPKCRSRRVKRLISRTSFVLKGGGWYSDLYSSSSGKPPESGGGKDAKGEGAEKKSSADKSSSAKSDKAPKSSAKTSKKSAA